MGYPKVPAVLAVVAASMVATVASGTAQAQSRDCVIVGNLAPIGFDSQGTIDMTSGETCMMHLTTSGTVEKSRVSLKPKNGTLTMKGAGSATYKPKAGFKGTDEFAVQITGRSQTGSGTSTLTVRANVR